MSQLRRIDDAPSTAIVGAVASVEGASPRTLDPLYDSIDPDALDALDALVADASRLRVQSEYEGHTVTVDASGRVELRGTAAVTATADTGRNAISD